jgi:sRNA-binding protein
MKKKPTKAPVLTGRDAWIARLRAGETVSFREAGNSMTPRIKSRQKCTYVPVRSVTDIQVGDAVFCKVGSSYFTHLVTAIRGDQVQIGNNHGHINGWTNISHIYGKVIRVEN